MSKFLTADWAQAVTDALGNHEGFKNAIGTATLSIQFHTEGGPEGDVNYYLAARDGSAAVSLGEIEGADVTVKQSYDTAMAISKGEMNTQTAFMTGKLKVSGNLAKLMQHQSAIQQWGAAVGVIDIEY
ncbi:MAG: SCP2 sterol-binding domain-containing protein [Actinobacteria bacterium]|nr:SCP2 sterol-binding domain-containing protein [Actinomycetota bacterium]